MRLVVVAAFVAALAGAAGARAAVPAAVHDCGSLSVGPGSLRHGGTTAAGCLLLAYRQGCKRAVYRLSSFGVDTIETETFQVVRVRARCEVAVTRAFRVVPQKPRVTAQGHCRTVRRAGASIVAGACTGSGLEATVSLTSEGTS